MNTLNLFFDYFFIKNSLSFNKITWYDIYFGLENKFIDINTVIMYTNDLLDEPKSEDNEKLLMFATLNRNKILTDDIIEMVDDVNDKTICETSDKFMYLSLLELFNKQLDFENVLVEVSIVYADFNYNEKIKDFIYYMPSEKDTIPSLTKYPFLKKYKKDERNIYLKWKLFLDDEKEKWQSDS